MAVFEAQTLSYKDGEIIFVEFERGDSFYLIQSGSVELVKTVGEVSKTLDILKPSEMFGEMALLEDSPRSATAIAQGETQLTCFDRTGFETLVLTNPHIAFKLLKMFVRRIYDAKRRFMILVLDDPHARVADVFLMLDEEAGKPAIDSGRREFSVNVENIARWAGLTITSAKESIDYYASIGYIEVFKGMLAIKNINNFIRIVNAARLKQRPQKK